MPRKKTPEELAAEQQVADLLRRAYPTTEAGQPVTQYSQIEQAPQMSKTGAALAGIADIFGTMESAWERSHGRAGAYEGTSFYDKLLKQAGQKEQSYLQRKSDWEKGVTEARMNLPEALRQAKQFQIQYGPGGLQQAQEAREAARFGEWKAALPIEREKKVRELYPEVALGKKAFAQAQEEWELKGKTGAISPEQYKAGLEEFKAGRIPKMEGIPLVPEWVEKAAGLGKVKGLPPAQPSVYPWEQQQQPPLTEQLQNMKPLPTPVPTPPMPSAAPTPPPAAQPEMIRVRIKQTGQTGKVPRNLFDPAIYEEIK